MKGGALLWIVDAIEGSLVPLPAALGLAAVRLGDLARLCGTIVASQHGPRWLLLMTCQLLVEVAVALVEV